MRFLMLLAALFLAQPVWAQAPIEVSDAYAHPPIGAGKVVVAFMTLKNASEVDYQLIGATSDVFDRIELHTHVQDGDIMKMRKLEVIELPAGQTVQLQSGGLHLMLFGAQGEMADGDMLPLSLSLQSAANDAPETVSVEVPLKARRAAKKADHHEHHGHH